MKCEELFGLFKEEHLTFFTGVPDSTFKAWMSFLHDKHGEDLTNIIACNECEAVAVAAGYHLATHELAVVYMQNSGVGKTVNPLTSLTDKEVYSIPMIMMIGWRGQPGEKDEPQHKKMGRVMIPLLETLEVPYSFLSDNYEESRKVIKEAVKEAKKNNSPYALIVKKELVEEYKAEKKKEMNYEM